MLVEEKCKNNAEHFDDSIKIDFDMLFRFYFSNTN